MPADAQAADYDVVDLRATAPKFVGFIGHAAALSLMSRYICMPSARLYVSRVDFCSSCWPSSSFHSLKISRIAFTSTSLPLASVKDWRARLPWLGVDVLFDGAVSIEEQRQLLGLITGNATQTLQLDPL